MVVNSCSPVPGGEKQEDQEFRVLLSKSEASLGYTDFIPKPTNSIKKSGLGATYHKLGCSSEVGHLLSTHQALSLIPGARVCVGVGWGSEVGRQMENER